MKDDVVASVVIPCYNSEAYVSRAIESALRQSYSEVEVVVVDDGSTDDSFEQISQFEDRVSVIPTKNKGASAARNTGLQASSGEYVKFLDADDTLYPGAVESQVHELRRLEGTNIVFGEGVWQSTDGKTYRKHFRSRKDEEERILHLMRVNPQTSLSLYPREVVQDVNGFDEDLRRYQDLDLNLRICLMGGEFRYFPHDITMVQMHEGEDRISNQPLVKENPLHRLRRLEKWREMVEKHGRSTPQIRRELAERAWNGGRAALRVGLVDAARQYFQFAKRLCSDPIPDATQAYKLTAKVFGPRIAERIAVTIRKLGMSQFIGSSIHPMYRNS